MNTLKHWLYGIRFYIALTTGLVSAIVWWWARASYGGTTLFPTRLEEVYAWISVGLIVMALTIGPSYKMFTKLPGRSIMFDARRLIGVSAGWFALLHVTIAYGSLFKFSNPLDLPSEYQQAFAVGFIALLILLAMTVTSFDAAFNTMGKWWFRLHRLIYVASGLILLHVFMIGVHATTTAAFGLLTVAAVGLLVMYIALLIRKPPTTIWRWLTVGSMIVYIVVVLLYGLHQHGRVQA